VYVCVRVCMWVFEHVYAHVQVYTGVCVCVSLYILCFTDISLYMSLNMFLACACGPLSIWLQVHACV